MNMKRAFTLMIVCLVAAVAYSEIKFSLNTGFGVSQYNGVSDAGNHFSGKIGMAVNIPLKQRWSVEPGLNYLTKGTQFNGFSVTDANFVIARFRNSLHYLSVPVNVKYSIPVSNNTKISIKCGPYIALGIKGTANMKTPMYNDYNENFGENLFSEVCNYGGKAFRSLESYLLYVILKSEEEQSGEDYNSDILRIHTEPFKRIDVGVNAGLELLYRHIIIGFNSEIGLTRISSDFLEGKVRNMASYIVVGYQF